MGGGATPAVRISRLNVKMNMLLRSIIGVKFVEGRPTLDTTTMYNQLGILKLKNLLKLRIYGLLVSLLNGSRPELFEVLLAQYLTLHNYATRNRAFRMPLVSCEVERQAVSYQLINLYNNIPVQFCNTDGNSHQSLVKNFKKHLFSIQ